VVSCSEFDPEPLTRTSKSKVGLLKGFYGQGQVWIKTKKAQSLLKSFKDDFMTVPECGRNFYRYDYDSGGSVCPSELTVQLLSLAKQLETGNAFATPSLISPLK